MTTLTKPLTRVVKVRPAAHGFKDTLIVTLFPDGRLLLREPHSRKPLDVDLATLYVKLCMKSPLHGA